MAIFGDLADFPFVEVIAMLEQQQGVLFLENIGRFSKLELHLSNDRLKRIIADETVIYDMYSTTNLLLKIAHLRQGNFEFRASKTHTDSPSPLNIKLKELLLRLTVLDDEWQSHLADLPDIETRFVAGNQELIWLEGELQTFWIFVEPLVKQGVTAQDLVLRFHLEPRSTQLNLYKLRTLGLIRPLRRIEDTAYYRQRYALETKLAVENLAAKVVVPDVLLGLPKDKIQIAQPPSPSLLSKLLGALRLMRSPI